MKTGGTSTEGLSDRPTRVDTGREELLELAGVLGRVAAEASHRIGVEFDVDNPEVARDLVTITFDALLVGRVPPSPSRRD